MSESNHSDSNTESSFDLIDDFENDQSRFLKLFDLLTSPFRDRLTEGRGPPVSCSFLFRFPCAFAASPQTIFTLNLFSFVVSLLLLSAT